MFKFITSLFFIAFLLIPFADQRVFLNIPVYPLDIIFGLIAIISLYFLWQKKERFDTKKYAIGFALAFFFMSTFLSWFINNPGATGLGQIKSWILLPALATFLGAFLLAGEKKRDHTLFMAWFGGITFLLTIILPYIFFGVSTFDGRLQGPFTSPNFLAMYLFPSCVLGLYFFQQTNSSFEKIAIFCVTLFALFALFLTQSLGGILALVVSILWWSYRYFCSNELFKKRVLVIIMGIFIFSLAFFPGDKVSSLLDERSSLASRITIWQVASRALQDSPVFGIGIGKFQEVYLAYQPLYPPYLEWAVPQPHNIWLAIWLQAGVIGVAVMVFFLYKIVIFSRDGRVKNEGRFVLESLLLGLLVYGLFDTPLFGNASALLWWTVLACILFPLREQGPERREG